jgi:hypothetical protein
VRQGKEAEAVIDRQVKTTGRPKEADEGWYAE